MTIPRVKTLANLGAELARDETFTASLEPHPLADLFPELEEPDLATLTADVKANGLHEPVILLGGRILDGRNRVRACREAGVPIRTRDYLGSDPAGFVLLLNLHRRHLTASQRAWVAAKLATLPRGRPNASIEAFPSQADAAKLLNVSRASVQRAREVEEHGSPELHEAVASGRVAISTAAEVAELPHREQRRFLVDPDTGADTLRRIRERRDQEREREATEPRQEAQSPERPSSVARRTSEVVDLADRLRERLRDSALRVACPPGVTYALLALERQISRFRAATSAAEEEPISEEDADQVEEDVSRATRVIDVDEEIPAEEPDLEEEPDTTEEVVPGDSKLVGYTAGKRELCLSCAEKEDVSKAVRVTAGQVTRFLADNPGFAWTCDICDLALLAGGES